MTGPNDWERGPLTFFLGVVAVLVVFFLAGDGTESLEAFSCLRFFAVRGGGVTIFHFFDGRPGVVGIVDDDGATKALRSWISGLTAATTAVEPITAAAAAADFTDRARSLVEERAITGAFFDVSLVERGVTEGHEIADRVTSVARLDRRVGVAMAKSLLSAEQSATLFRPRPRLWIL